VTPDVPFRIHNCDGKRFLMRRDIGGARIIVEKNWLPEIKSKLGAPH